MDHSEQLGFSLLVLQVPGRPRRLAPTSDSGLRMLMGFALLAQGFLIFFLI